VARPFYKWPGSKVWLVEILSPYLKNIASLRVVEPFAGSAAFFLGSTAQRALLGDTNLHVAHALEGVRDGASKVIKNLRKLSNTKEVYSEVRNSTPRSKFSAAARLIYLTNTSWGGLYRENKLGKFNVPFGNNGRSFYSVEIIKEASTKLAGCEIHNQNYRKTLASIRKKDFIFVDAPYVTKRSAEFFDRYHASKFSWDDQVELAELLQSGRALGKPILVTCAADPDLYALFPGWAVVEFFKRNSMTAKDKLGYRREALLLSSELSSLAEALAQDGIGERVR
jgi:DNA adenine methylase